MAVLLICEDRTHAAQADALARLALEEAARRGASWAVGMFGAAEGVLVWDGTAAVEPDQPQSPRFVPERHARRRAGERDTRRPIRGWGASPKPATGARR